MAALFGQSARRHLQRVAVRNGQSHRRPADAAQLGQQLHHRHPADRPGPGRESPFSSSPPLPPWSSKKKKELMKLVVGWRLFAVAGVVSGPSGVGPVQRVDGDARHGESSVSILDVVR